VGHAFELALAQILDLGQRLDRGGEPAAHQDLAVGGLAAQPRGEVDDGADRGVVEAILEADAAQRGVALRHADAEAQAIAAPSPL
jgi:hypothetical protein